MESGKGMNPNSPISRYKGMELALFALSMLVLTADTAVINNVDKIIVNGFYEL